MIWRYNKSCELYRWYDDAESYFVLNKLSGQTHVLSQLAVDTVELLKQEALDEKNIFNRLAILYENLDLKDAEAYQYVLDILSSLDELGLIEPSCSA